MRAVAIQPNLQVPIPTEVFKRLRWEPGRTVYIYALEDGVAIRSNPSRVLEAAQEFESIMQSEGLTMRDLLKGVAEQRERRYQQRKKQGSPATR